ncbi:MAG: DUF4375 domain-containing protein [Pirellulaceae bacterium]|jgi:hypothetical protein|nr:DUF4375 domain-containing protein [Pirellulaceae bacterium]
MLDWLKNLFRKRRVGLLLEGTPSSRLFPTPDTISEWDDQGLYVATGCESTLRYHKSGFETLNDPERSLCCLYLLESAVNNGGFGHWIESLCPRSAAETQRTLRKIGATKMASLTADALRPLGDTTAIDSRDEWVEHYLSMPDNIHEHWETLTRPFLELEDQFLDLAYRYARVNWERVRPSGNP